MGMPQWRAIPVPLLLVACGSSDCFIEPEPSELTVELRAASELLPGMYAIYAGGHHSTVGQLAAMCVVDVPHDSSTPISCTENASLEVQDGMPLRMVADIGGPLSLQAWVTRDGNEIARLEPEIFRTPEAAEAACAAGPVDTLVVDL